MPLCDRPRRRGRKDEQRQACKKCEGAATIYAAHSNNPLSPARQSCPARTVPRGGRYTGGALLLPLSQPVDSVDSSYGVLTTSLLISLSDSFPEVPGGRAKSSVVDIKVGS